MISLIVESEQTNKQAHRYKEQTGGCQRWEVEGMGKMGEGGKKIKRKNVQVL